MLCLQAWGVDNLHANYIKAAAVLSLMGSFIVFVVYIFNIFRLGRKYKKFNVKWNQLEREDASLLKRLQVWMTALIGITFLLSFYMRVVLKLG